MNREIKFRGKRVDNGQWVHGCLITYWKPDSDKYVGIIGWKGDHFEVNPETVGQYTGLKDKDGNEIYEGDQLYICAGYWCVVKFQDGMFVGVYSHFEDGEIVPLHEHNTTKCQIIHDNPELIK